MGLIGFLRHQWQDYQFTRKKIELNQKMQKFVDDSKKLPGGELKEKYGNPSRYWALMVGERYKIKQEMKEKGFE